jgi:hypothetical protein
MSLQDFQHVLSELVMSPAFRARVAADPEPALAAFELSPRERRRLADLARSPGMQTGTMLHRANRLSMLSNTLPRSCKVLGPRGLKELVHAYWSGHPPETQLYVREAQRFAGYALARLAEGSFAHEFLREVLETELAILVLGRAGEAWQPPADVLAARDSGTLVPRLHPLCRVVAWRHDPDAVLDALDGGQPLAGLPAGEHYLLLTAGAGGRVTMKPVSAEAGRALLAAGNGESLAALAEQVGVARSVFEELVGMGYLVC